MHGVSRQAVSWHKTTYGGQQSTRQIVNQAWPWETTSSHSKSAAYQRLRDHGEFIATGGRDMSDFKRGRHTAWLKMMRENDFVLEFDPNIPPTPRIAPGGGFAYRRRDPRIDGFELLIRVNEFTNLTPEGRRLWSYAPGTSPRAIGLDAGGVVGTSTMDSNRSRIAIAWPGQVDGDEAVPVPTDHHELGELILNAIRRDCLWLPMPRRGDGCA